MCVVAVAWDVHPDWQLVVAGNRDEVHARCSAPLAYWDDAPDIIAGRDLVSGGSWLGVSAQGRFAVVTNIRDEDGPNASKQSRGALVADWLRSGNLPLALDAFNPFNLIITDRHSARLISNRPGPTEQWLNTGIHGLSNAIPDEHWPRKDRLVEQMTRWIGENSDGPEALLDLLAETDAPDRNAHKLFIRSPIYGTRCSSVVAVDRAGRGLIIERVFDPTGRISGERKYEFCWT